MQNNTQKKVFVIAVAICLISILSMGTLAWFNDSDSVVNTFKVADSDGDGAPDFAVDLWEQDPNEPLDPNGDILKKDAVTYEDIAPGEVIAKNPTVQNMGDYGQWIRVYVTFDEWSKIKTACGNHPNEVTTDLRDWLNVDTNAWYAVPTAFEDATNDTVTYIYYYNSILSKQGETGDTATLFTTLTIPEAFEQEDMQFASGDFSVTIKAQAIQSDNTYDATATCPAEAAFNSYWKAEYEA